jgi:hypothetical protein
MEQKTDYLACDVGGGAAMQRQNGLFVHYRHGKRGLIHDAERNHHGLGFSGRHLEHSCLLGRFWS